MLEAPIQKVKEAWNKVWGTEKEGLDIGDLTGYEERVGEMSLFVIEGKVSNQSRFTKKQIKVKVDHPRPGQSQNGGERSGLRPCPFPSGIKKPTSCLF